MTFTTDEIREKFLNFFIKKHNSTLVKSSSLIPNNPTILLTTAGMVQFVPYFLGLEKPSFNPARATSCQKCARAGGKDSDIENVGRTPRHHTFFEMLGNFSFGDYFKKEIIPWSWDFVTNYLHLETERLWVTIYEDDDEAYEIWTNVVKVPKERVIRKGKKDNFWGPPGVTGPCGPCSEIHYDLGEEFKCSDDCSIATCECNRWVEIWNLVFMELFKDENGNFSPLEKKNVDTGMGLERIAMVCQKKTSTFETDLLQSIINKVADLAKTKYGNDEKTDVSLRIITDHIRCVTFMTDDGIIPANEGRNYVLRMILRRALRHGKMLGLELPFLYNLVDFVVDSYKKTYPSIFENKEKIKKIIKEEEERFKLTLDRGYKLIDELIADKKDIDGKNAFKLYDTYGFPLELTIEIADENNLKVDVDGFNKEMQLQRQRAKDSAQKIILTDDLVYVEFENKFGKTDFVGYEKTSCEAKVLGIIENNDFTDIILDETPFYAESGGQVGDVGFLNGVKVINTFKVNHLFVHRCEKNSEFKIGDIIFAKIDEKRREEIKIHHSNAHLLQAALIKVLGSQVHQKGSSVEENRTRFDFSFSRSMTKDEIKKVEMLVNSWINEGINQKTTVMNIDEAKNSGAMALFGEKYEDNVRVVEFGNVSKELCGGTHVQNSAELRLMKIVNECAISAGVRRIEAVCSKSAIENLNEKANIVDEINHKLKTNTSEILDRIDKFQSENFELTKEIIKLKIQIANNRFSSFISKAKDIEGGKLFISRVEDFDNNVMKTGIELLSNKLGESVIVIVSVKENSLAIIAKVSNSFVQKGINAGQIVSKIAKATCGNGGGRADFAQGGGKDASNLDEILLNLEKELLK